MHRDMQGERVSEGHWDHVHPAMGRPIDQLCSRPSSSVLRSSPGSSPEFYEGHNTART